MVHNLGVVNNSTSNKTIYILGTYIFGKIIRGSRVKINKFGIVDQKRLSTTVLRNIQKNVFNNYYIYCSLTVP